MAEFVWASNVQAENKQVVEHYLESVKWIIPSWVQTLRLAVESSDNAELLATCTVHEKYREAAMTVRPLWFTVSEKDKITTLIHELLHIHLNPLYDFSRNAIKRYSKDEHEEQREIIFDEMDCYLERSTEDLTNVIFAQLQKETAAACTYRPEMHTEFQDRSNNGAPVNLEME
jgi:hypothetical protein